MRFNFNEDHLAFQDTVRGFLQKECTAEHLRVLWDTETGRSSELWTKLAEMGLLGLLVPEEHGGLGMNEIDFVLVLEETGRAALPEPLVETAVVAAPLIRDAGNAALAAEWLPRIAAGDAVVAVGHPQNPLVADAHVADLLLLAHDGEIHAVEPAAVKLERQTTNDGARRLFQVEWTPSDATRIATGDRAQELLDAALDRAAMALAAQQVGLGQQMIDVAVGYACDREQFGKPIGSFQAVKHMLASVQVAVEFSRPVVYRAAAAVATGAPERAITVSHAKAAASQAALEAAKTALQVHGGIGYTFEVDLHMWMKRAWSLDLAWGTRPWHRERIAQRLLDSDSPAPRFGFEPRT